MHAGTYKLNRLHPTVLIMVACWSVYGCRLDFFCLCGISFVDDGGSYYVLSTYYAPDTDKCFAYTFYFNPHKVTLILCPFYI